MSAVPKLKPVIKKAPVALICPDEGNREVYSIEIDRRGFETQVFASIKDFQSVATKSYFLAIVIDLSCINDCSYSEKLFLSRAEECIPLMRIRSNPESKKFLGYVGTTLIEGTNSFEHFLFQFVTNFKHRRLRKEDRLALKLPILISESLEGPTIYKGMTLNAAPSGIFIVSFETFQNGKDYYLQIPNVHKGKFKMRATARWDVPFEKAQLEFPGVGLEIRARDDNFLKLLDPKKLKLV